MPHVRKSLTRMRAPITWAIAVTFVTMLAGTCLVEAQQMAQGQHACCTDTGDCDVAVQADCCPSEEAPAQLAASALVLLPPLTAVVSPVAFVPEPPSLSWRDVDFKRSAPKLDGTPTYILISTFRI